MRTRAPKSVLIRSRSVLTFGGLGSLLRTPKLVAHKKTSGDCGRSQWLSYIWPTSAATFFCAFFRLFYRSTSSYCTFHPALEADSSFRSHNRFPWFLGRL